MSGVPSFRDMERMRLRVRRLRRWVWRSRPAGMRATLDGVPYVGAFSYTITLNQANELRPPIPGTFCVYALHERRLFGRWFPRVVDMLVAVWTDGRTPLDVLRGCDFVENAWRSEANLDAVAIAWNALRTDACEENA